MDSYHMTEAEFRAAANRQWERSKAIESACRKLGASASDIPGLWIVPGHPELTTNQLLHLAADA